MRERLFVRAFMERKTLYPSLYIWTPGDWTVSHPAAAAAAAAAAATPAEWRCAPSVRRFQERSSICSSLLAWQQIVALESRAPTLLFTLASMPMRPVPSARAWSSAAGLRPFGAVHVRTDWIRCDGGGGGTPSRPKQLGSPNLGLKRPAGRALRAAQGCRLWRAMSAAASHGDGDGSSVTKS